MDIEIAIKDSMLRAYLPSLFKKISNGSYVVGAKNLTGAAICIFAKSSLRPIPHSNQGDEQVVRFTLADSKYNRSLKNKHLYISHSDEERINLVLRREFDQDFYSFYESNRRDGVKINEVIENFVVARAMEEFFLGDIESLKNRVRLHRIKSLAATKERLRQKIYYRKTRKSKS